jgi:hypothetical protein
MEINFYILKLFIFIIISFIGYIFYAKWFIDYNLYPHTNLIRDSRKNQ